jgi:hypothetical protein
MSSASKPRGNLPPHRAHEDPAYGSTPAPKGNPAWSKPSLISKTSPGLAALQTSLSSSEKPILTSATQLPRAVSQSFLDHPDSAIKPSSNSAIVQSVGNEDQSLTETTGQTDNNSDDCSWTCEESSSKQEQIPREWKDNPATRNDSPLYNTKEAPEQSSDNNNTVQGDIEDEFGLIDTWPYKPAEMAQLSADSLAIELDNENQLQHPLALYEYQHQVLKNQVKLDLVLEKHQPFRVSVEIFDHEKRSLAKFNTDLFIKITFFNAMPTFVLYHTQNPQNSSQSSNFRRFAIGFDSCNLDIAVSENSLQFFCAVENPELVLAACNSDAPSSLAPSEFEKFILQNKGRCVTWGVSADASVQENVVQWGVRYWFNELKRCRHSLQHRVREWATNFKLLLQKEDADAFSSRQPSNILAKSFNVFPTTAIPQGPHRMEFGFTRPEGFSLSSGTIVAISADNGFFSTNPPKPMMKLPPSDYIQSTSPWLALILTTDPLSDAVRCLLLHNAVSLDIPELEPCSVQRYQSSSKLSKALLARVHVYFKIIDKEIAKREAEGVKHADRAPFRHNLDFLPLIFHDYPLPTRSTHLNNYPADTFPESKRQLNVQQRAVLDQCIISAGRLVIMNGPPGTGKSLVLSKAIIHAAVQGKPTLVTAATNVALDVLLQKTLSTLASEAPNSAGMLRIIRIVAPSGSTVELLTKLSLSDDAQDSFTRAYDLDMQRVELAKRQNTHDSVQFLDLNAKLQRDGYLSNEKETRDWKKLAHNFDSVLIKAAHIIFVTTSVASSNVLLNGFHPEMIILDESAYARDEQVFNAIVWYHNVQLVIFAGDPKQLPPFVMKRQKNPLGTSLHARLVDREFAGVVQLTEQHRMEENLIEFINNRFYNNVLTTSAEVRAGRAGMKAFRLILEKNLQLPSGPTISFNNVLFDVANGFGTSDSTGSTKNVAEAMLAVELITTLVEGGADPASILLISPYSAQVVLLKQLLAQAGSKISIDLYRNVQVQTIDSTQGNEADIVILTMARGGVGKKLGFIEEIERVVVALTRGRYARYVLANYTFFANIQKEFDFKAFAIWMYEAGNVKVVNVAGAPALPPPANQTDREGRPRLARNREHRASRHELEPVELPSELPEIQMAAANHFRLHDANDN